MKVSRDTYYYNENDARNIWNLMMKRCDANTKNYEDVKVCEEWKNINNFIPWYMANTYGTKQWRLELDKDLFGEGKRIYSPETCCMLPKSLNILLSTCGSRNELLPGVTQNISGSFKVSVLVSAVKIVKTFKTEEEAFSFYKENKENAIRIAANAYSWVIPKKIHEALINYKVKSIRGVYHSSFHVKPYFPCELKRATFPDLKPLSPKPLVTDKPL